MKILWCLMSHAWCNMTHAWCNMQQAACIVQHAWSNLRRATCTRHVELDLPWLHIACPALPCPVLPCPLLCLAFLAMRLCKCSFNMRNVQASCACNDCTFASLLLLLLCSVDRLLFDQVPLLTCSEHSIVHMLNVMNSKRATLMVSKTAFVNPGWNRCIIIL